MYSRLQGDQNTLRYLWPTYSRFVRHSAEQRGQGILFTPPRPSSLAGQFPSLQVDWLKGLLYMYPPLPLLSLALHKVIREEAQVIAILPW